MTLPIHRSLLRLIRSLWRPIIVVLCAMTAPASTKGDEAVKSPEAPVAPQNIAAFFTLDGVIADNGTAAVRRIAMQLQAQAIQEKKQAFLVLELSPGVSEFHHVYSMIDFLTSDATANLTTICWVPKTVAGNNACVALACSEIVLHPEAELGDIGRGGALPASDQLIVKSIVSKRRNRRVTESLVVGLMDPASSIFQLTIESSPGTIEKRIVTQEEAAELRQANFPVRDSKQIKDSGVAWKINAAQAREWGVLAGQVVTSRAELASTYALPIDSLSERPNRQGDQNVAFIKINGMIDPVLSSFLQRQVERAVEGHADLILCEIDSLGGFQFECDDLAETLAGLKDRGVHTVAYIPIEASGGAAVIACGCDDIYLGPQAKIGDVAFLSSSPRRGHRGQAPPPPPPPPNKWNPNEPPQPQSDISSTIDLLGELAVSKNRPAAILKAMADPNLVVYQATHQTQGTVSFRTEEEIHATGEVWVKGPPIAESGSGKRLFLTGRRAHELQIARSPVESLDELKQVLGISAQQRLAPMERTWVDDFVFWLNRPTVMALLFFIGLVAIYKEMFTMTGVFGLVSAVCFGLYFWSKVLGGTAGMLEVVLFVIGVVCLLLEFLVLPGFGVFGLTGGILTLASIVMAAQTFGHLGPNMSDFDQTFQTLKIFGSAMLGVMVCAFALAKYLPQIPLFHDMILHPPSQDSFLTPRLKPELIGKAAALVGKTGLTLTQLRPSGKAEVDGQIVDVMSEGVFIPEGNPIEVIECHRHRIVVRQIEQIDEQHT